MKRVALILSLLLLVAANARAQESHITTRYEKSVDRTIVHSDVLYVVNSPLQFMQIQLVGRYAGKGKATQLPDRLYIEFYSFAPDALYQMDAKHRLLVKVDEKVFSFGLLDYSNVEGKAKTEKDPSNRKAPKSNIGFNVSLPSAAVITQTHKKDALTVEFMSIDSLTLGDLKMLAGANDLAMKIGDTVFPFRPGHTGILREFTEAITPANAEALLPKELARETIPADVPSSEKQTSLSETLKWLKAQIERNGATNDILTPKKFDPLKFDSCQIMYRVTPLVRTSQVSSSLINLISQFHLDLADLNPEALRVADLGDYATVSMTTRDYQPKIKFFAHANEQGTPGRTLEEAVTASASINFKNKTAALHFKAAFAHAINLCHAQR